MATAILSCVSDSKCVSMGSEMGTPLFVLQFFASDMRRARPLQGPGGAMKGEGESLTRLRTPHPTSPMETFWESDLITPFLAWFAKFRDAGMSGFECRCWERRFQRREGSRSSQSPVSTGLLPSHILE